MKPNIILREDASLSLSFPSEERNPGVRVWACLTPTESRSLTRLFLFLFEPIMVRQRLGYRIPAPSSALGGLAAKINGRISDVFYTSGVSSLNGSCLGLSCARAFVLTRGSRDFCAGPRSNVQSRVHL